MTFSSRSGITDVVVRVLGENPLEELYESSLERCRRMRGLRPPQEPPMGRAKTRATRATRGRRSRDPVARVVSDACRGRPPGRIDPGIGKRVFKNVEELEFGQAGLLELRLKRIHKESAVGRASRP